MTRFNLDSISYNPLSARSKQAVDYAMRNLDILDAKLWERRNPNPTPNSRASIKRKGTTYRKRNNKPKIANPLPKSGGGSSKGASDSSKGKTEVSNESGYERARAHAMQLLREREARKQKELNGKSNSAEANSRELNLTTERGKRLAAITQKNYGEAQYNNDIKGIGGLGLAGAGSATTRVGYKMLRNIIKGDISLSNLWRGSLAPYGGKSLRNAIVNGFERAIKGVKETVKPKPAKIGEQASRFAKGVTRRSKEVVQPTRTKIGEQVTGYVKNGITRRERSNVIENAGPYLNKGEETSRSLLSRVRGKLEGVVARRRGYTDNGMPATSKAGSGVGGNGTQSYIINSGGTPRWRVRQMKQAAQSKAKPTQSTQSSASSTQSPKPTRTQSRKQKMRGNQSRNNYRQAQRAKRNDKGTITL